LQFRQQHIPASPIFPWQSRDLSHQVCLTELNAKS
jgi:hypothetical protein